MISSAAYLALISQRNSPLHLNSTIGELFPACSHTTIASVTAVQLMSMRAHQLDNRLSMAWRAVSGLSDHAAFPPFCDGLNVPLERCIEEYVCPAFATTGAITPPSSRHPIAITPSSRATITS